MILLVVGERGETLSLKPNPDPMPNPSPMMSWSSSRDRNKYSRIWRRSISFFKECSLSYCDAIYRLALLFVCSRSHICHERTTMTSEISENTIFVRFSFTLCYLILTSVYSSIHFNFITITIRVKCKL